MCSVLRICQVAFGASLAWNLLSSYLLYPDTHTHACILTHTHICSLYSLSLSHLFSHTPKCVAQRSASSNSLLWSCCSPGLPQTRVHHTVVTVLLNCYPLQGKDYPLWFNLCMSNPGSVLGTVLDSCFVLFCFRNKRWDYRTFNGTEIWLDFHVRSFSGAGTWRK